MINPLDKSRLFESIIALPQQCRHAYESTQSLVIPHKYQQINQIIMSGMGGSALGGRVIESVYGPSLKLPLFILTDYDLPAWADQKTLVVASSFSGTTEETVNTVKQALSRGCPLLVIANGGDLIDLAIQSHSPYYQIDPVYNPSKQPRMAIGYSVIGQLMMLAKLNLINFDVKEIDFLVQAMEKIIANNSAREFAQKMFNKQVIFVSARHLTGAAHTIKNQMNENAKNLSQRQDLPELNHHLMEGLRFPKTNPETVVFFFLDSSLYPPRMRQRLKITQTVVAKNQIEALTWTATAKQPLAEAFEAIQFGALVVYHLANLYQIDPAAIPWVDYFKKELAYQPTGSNPVG